MALSWDENTFPDASQFDPSPHLTTDGQLKDRIGNHFAFGHNRRICPSWSIANSLTRSGGSMSRS
ncbi:hypothetical protein K503DRAFT_774545 [Rhizopogon vinicolor AM-OR11-026]|uniref:Cytochrome P450 n=1 Tax=Rhizopogon vinicolor AM-OR11-026 TaxID=1314800 RepID=A0A1B7MP93_9AGAM|nr:hypothetical protein K503DRAFT_774545 [Rhizopogon vinicolor AM-OR11-026]